MPDKKITGLRKKLFGQYRPLHLTRKKMPNDVKGKKKTKGKKK